MHFSLLLAAMEEGDESVQKMAAFLHGLYSKCFSEFPINVNQVFKKVMFQYLENWTVDNLDNPNVITVLIKLITHFYNAGDGILKETIWYVINRWKAHEGEEEKMNAFINEIRKRIFISKRLSDGK